MLPSCRAVLPGRSSLARLFSQCACSCGGSALSAEQKSKIDGVIAKVLEERKDGILAEHEVYQVLEAVGMKTPQWRVFRPGEDLTSFTQSLPLEGPWVAKGVLRARKDGVLVTHKTDISAIEFNVFAKDIPRMVDVFDKRFGEKTPFAVEGILFAQQLKLPSQFGGELLVSALQDSFFGPTVAFGFGGTIVEYLKKVMKPSMSNVFLPAAYDFDTYRSVLRQLPAAMLAEGKVRGMKPLLTEDHLLKTLKGLSTLIREYSPSCDCAKYVISEIEVNPAVPIGGDLMALDGVMHVHPKVGGGGAKKPLEKLTKMLYPRSALVAGVSTTNAKNPGNKILQKLRVGGIPVENLFALHPSAKEFEGGIRAVRSVQEAKAANGGNPVDLFVIGVPASATGPIMKEALREHIAESISIISGGFGETKAGEKMQREIEADLKALNESPERRPVVNGPNTVGNVCSGGADTVFTPVDRSSRTEKGATNCALICQSGAFMLTRLSDLANVVKPAIALSVGNQMDLSATDYFEYLLENRKDMTTFALYVEGLNHGDGIRLMHLVRKAKAVGKYVVVYKAARTEAGQEAAKGHTAAMSGDFAQFKFLVEHAGAMVADSFAEFNDLLMATTRCTALPQILRERLLAKRPVGIVGLSNAGFEKCSIADHLLTEESPARLVKFSDGTIKILSTLYKKYGIGAIVDVSDVLDLTPMVGDEGYEAIIRATLLDAGTAAGIYAVVPETDVLKSLASEITMPKSLCQKLIKMKKDFLGKKELLVVVESGWKFDPYAQALLDAGIATFRSADSASRVLAKMLKALMSP